MNKVFPHSDRKGTDAALDLVEETLASLRRRVQEEGERGNKVKDATTNTTPPPPPPPSITSSKASKKHRQTSVLIKRKSKNKGKRTKHGNNSTQENLGTQVLEEEPEQAGQEYCKHCHPRTEEGQNKTTNAHQERRTTTKPLPNDPKFPGMRERITWKKLNRGYRRQEESEISSQDCFCYNYTCRPLYDELDTPDVRERVAWKHGKRHHRRREESEQSSQDYMHYSNTCRNQRPARHLHDDTEESDVREQVLWRRGKRGHSRREESDSSCHSNTRKTHRRTRSSAKIKQTPQEDESIQTVTKSRERQDTREKSAVGRVYKLNEQSKGKVKKTATHQMLPVDVESQGYAQPTQSSKQRTDHSQPRKKEKENIIPYIPCGAKSHSYHMGVIAQQEMGRLIHQPLHTHTHTHTHSRPPGSSRQQEGVAATCSMQQTVRQAMANIHHHLKGHHTQ